MADPAKMYLAGSNQACEVALEIVNEQLLVAPFGDRDSQLLDFSELDIVPPMPSLPCEVVLSDGSKLEFSADSEIAAHLYKADKGNALIAWLEGNLWACIAATLLLPLSFYWLNNSVIPAAAMGVAEMIPANVSRNIDEQVIKVFDERVLEPSELDEAQQLNIQQHWQSILNQLAVEPDQFQLFIKKSELYGANAFALPGGTVVVTDDLAKLFVDHPDALNAILLHEIGHVVERHSLRMMTESIGTSLMITYFFGDLEGMAELFSGTALTLMQNKFSRDMEREADQYSIDHLAMIGADADSFIQAMEKLKASLGEEKSQPLLEYLSTHPQFEERIQRAKQ